MPARILVMGGESASSISTKLNMVSAVACLHAQKLQSTKHIGMPCLIGRDTADYCTTFPSFGGSVNLCLLLECCWLFKLPLLLMSTHPHLEILEEACQSCWTFVQQAQRWLESITGKRLCAFHGLRISPCSETQNYTNRCSFGKQMGDALNKCFRIHRKKYGDRRLPCICQGLVPFTGHLLLCAVFSQGCKSSCSTLERCLVPRLTKLLSLLLCMPGILFPPSFASSSLFSIRAVDFCLEETSCDPVPLRVSCTVLPPLQK